MHLDYLVYIVSMLPLHFLLVPSASDQSFQCRKHPVRDISLGPSTGPLLLVSFGYDSYLEFDSLGYTRTIKPCTYIGIETHFWLDSRTVRTTRSLYRSPSTAPFTVTVTISRSCSLRLVHLGLPVLCSGHFLDYPLHFSLRLWTSFQLLPYLESL